MAGDADDKKQELNSSTQHFFKKEKAAFGEMVDAGKQERAATPQEFINPATPVQKTKVDNADR